jgi:hypothetical protein
VPPDQRRAVIGREHNAQSGLRCHDVRAYCR